MSSNTGLRLPSISTITNRTFDAHSPRSTASPLVPAPHVFEDATKSLQLAASYSTSDSLNSAIENARKATRMLEEYRDSQTSPPARLKSVSAQMYPQEAYPHEAYPRYAPYPVYPHPPATSYAAGPPRPMAYPMPHAVAAPRPHLPLSYHNQPPRYAAQSSTALQKEPQCQRCGSTETPEWRRGPNGSRTLCNACGLYHSKLVKRKGIEAAAKEILQKKYRVTNAKNGQKVLLSASDNVYSSSKGKHIMLNHAQYDKLNQQWASQQSSAFRSPPMVVPHGGFYGYYPQPMAGVPPPPHFAHPSDPMHSHGPF